MKFILTLLKDCARVFHREKNHVNPKHTRMHKMQYVTNVNKNEVLKNLQSGLVEFHYHKEDGDTRVVKGTLCVRLFPQAKGVDFLNEQINKALEWTKSYGSMVRVFDVTVSDWRTVDLDYLTSLPQVVN
jgi:hypothetical protein